VSVSNIRAAVNFPITAALQMIATSSGPRAPQITANIASKISFEPASRQWVVPASCATNRRQSSIE
jgi:hypothetical protein